MIPARIEVDRTPNRVYFRSRDGSGVVVSVDLLAYEAAQKDSATFLWHLGNRYGHRVAAVVGLEIARLRSGKP